MRILSLDAATKGLGVALTNGDKLLATACLNVGKTHSQRLIPLVNDLLQAGNLSLADIDLVAVTIGPGSFTGLRIGISSAKAIAYALGLPMVGVKTLDALAVNCVGSPNIICPILDARRNEVYYGVYESRENNIYNIEEISSLPPADLAEHLGAAYPDRRVIFLGDAADIYFSQMQEIMGDKATLAPAARRIFMADSAAFYAEAHQDEALTPQEIKAFYLRPSEAERQRKARLANEQ